MYQDTDWERLAPVREESGFDPEEYRIGVRRDAARVTHSAAFRRLPDLAELAGWCHDLGHPPFGHNGEYALDEMTRTNSGGFEGNAQTLRILSVLEKRQHSATHESGIDDGQDLRHGLNLCARTLGAVLKYDRPIPILGSDREDSDRVVKGYYASDKSIVEWIKSCVGGASRTGSWKTVECQVMDLADDIAYSTYDLEDAFKADSWIR